MKTSKEITLWCMQPVLKNPNNLSVVEAHKEEQKRENKKWFSEEEVYDKITQLKYFVGNMRFKISNESLTKFYNKIKELGLEK